MLLPKAIFVVDSDELKATVEFEPPTVFGRCTFWGCVDRDKMSVHFIFVRASEERILDDCAFECLAVAVVKTAQRSTLCVDRSVVEAFSICRPLFFPLSSDAPQNVPNAGGVQRLRIIINANDPSTCRERLSR